MVEKSIEQIIEELEVTVLALNQKVNEIERTIDTILQAGRPAWTPGEGQTTIDAFITSEHA